MITPPPELTCQELVELVTEYLEQTLPPAERARFEAHLAECRGCRTYVEQMRQTIQMLGTLPEESLTPDAQAVLLDTFRTWKRQP
jgi:anti-sigma factor RsiW